MSRAYSVRGTHELCGRGHKKTNGRCLLCKKILHNKNRKREELQKDILREKQKSDHTLVAKRHGVTVEFIRSIVERAGGKCEACGDSLSGKKSCIDHCHETGHVRGILCNRCNTAEGFINDRVRLEAIQEYLEVHAWRLRLDHSMETWENNEQSN